MQRLFLIQIFRESKWLFALVLLMIAGQLFFNQKKIHSFPWFVWDMYSKVEQLPDTVSMNIIYLDGQRYDYMQLPYWSQIAIRRSSDYYYSMLRSDFIDPNAENVLKRLAPLPTGLAQIVKSNLINTRESAASYPDWLTGFIYQHSNKPFAQLELRRVFYQYRDGSYKALPGEVSLFTVKISER